jgi:hypothetical protein
LFIMGLSGFPASIFPFPIHWTQHPPASAPLHCRVGWALGAWTLPCPSHPPIPWGGQRTAVSSTLGVLPIKMGTVCMKKNIYIYIYIYIYTDSLYS